ncbi:MAG: hypothetical protein ABI634_12685 [Acidobacteriota bacterium]
MSAIVCLPLDFVVNLAFGPEPVVDVHAVIATTGFVEFVRSCGNPSQASSAEVLREARGWIW